MKRLNFLLICLLTGAVLTACGPSQAELDAQATKIAADIFATQTAEAPTDTPIPTPTPVPTDTPTPIPTDTPTLTVEETTDAGSDSQTGDTITLPKTPTPSPTSTPTFTPEATTTPTQPPPPPATPTPSQQWILVADSAADFPGPIQDRKWWYLWSKGRNNFYWQDMAETPDCYRSPNEMTLAICRDQITVDSHSRGDAALQWKAREGGTYRFEWNSSVDNRDKTTLRFYKHLDFVGDQGPGPELPFSAVVEDVIQWELFFWVPQYDTPYQVKVYKLQE